MNLVEYTTFLVKSLSKNPDRVKVSTFGMEDNYLMIQIIVDINDKGFIIGSGGVTINAIKTMLRAKSYIDNTKHIKINVDAY